MHPTANSAALMQGFNACFVECAAGDAQRSVPSRLDNQVKEPLTKAEASAMTVNERLFVSGLLGDFDEAVVQRDIPELERILRSVYLEPENIGAIISQVLSSSNGAA